MVFTTPNPGSVRIPRVRMPTGGDRLSMKFKFRFVNRGSRINDYVKKWERAFLNRSGAAIKTWVTKSFKRRKKKSTHSPRGTPPYLHGKKSDFLSPAMAWSRVFAEKSVVVGVRRSKAGIWGLMHEHGGIFKESSPQPGGQKTAFFHARPFVQPAFVRWRLANRHVPSGMKGIMKDTKEWAYK